jgi:hypothetical protein
MNRFMAMILAALVLTGCTSQTQSPARDPFANRTTFPPPPTGEATKDPYYNAVSSPMAASTTGAPGISNAPAPVSTAPPIAAANNTPTPANNSAAASRGIALQGAQSPANVGNRASTNASNSWTSAGPAEDRFPRPTTDAANISSRNQNVTTQTLAPRSDDATTGQLRDISDLPRNL